MANTDGMSKSDWEQKERRTRASIEGQVALKELGDGLRSGLWDFEGGGSSELLERYTSIITQLLDEWGTCNNFTPVEKNIPTEDVAILINRGKSLCHILKLDWDKELREYAAKMKAGFDPPSRVLVETLVKNLKRIWEQEQEERKNDK